MRFHVAFRCSAGGVFRCGAVERAAVPAEEAAARAGKPPTAAEAKAFLDEAETKLLALANEASRAGWVQSTFITDDTEILAAQANERVDRRRRSRYAKKAARFDGSEAARRTSPARCSS